MQLSNNRRVLLDVEVDVLEPLLDIEARTGLLDPGEVSVTDDLGFGIVEG